MQRSLRSIAAALLLSFSVTASGVPITIKFVGEVRDFLCGDCGGLELGDPVKGSWTYDSDASIGSPWLNFPGGTTYVSEGSPYGFTIQAGSLPSFTLNGADISIYDDILLDEFTTDQPCGAGFGRVADVYRVGWPGSGFSGANFVLYDCSANAFDSDALPAFAPHLGDGDLDFVQGGIESAGIVDFSAVGGGQTLVRLNRVVSVTEPGTLILLGLGLVLLALVRPLAAMSPSDRSGLAPSGNN